jgi:hypothetical protein
MSQRANEKTNGRKPIMLEKRFVAGKWMYRASGTLVWSYSRTDVMERLHKNIETPQEPLQQRKFRLYTSNPQHPVTAHR